MPWGTITYRDQEQAPVALRSERCRSHAPDPLEHPCKLITGHAGAHRRICGKRWDARAEA